MTVANRIQEILDDDRLDDESIPETRSELIEGIIHSDGWGPVQDQLISVLKDDSAPYRDWQSAADVFWEAALDKRDVDFNIVIGLLYRRLKPDEHSSENNQAWSIVCQLKGVGYNSDYDPMADPDIVAAMKSLAEPQR